MKARRKKSSVSGAVDDLMEALRSTRPDQKELKKLQTLHAQIGKELQDGSEQLKWKRLATRSLAVFGVMLLGHWILSVIEFDSALADAAAWVGNLDSDFYWVLLAGFVAQLVDGSLGMGYGIISASFLLSLGINLAAVSGSIHTAEMFSSGVSGYSHYRFGNVDRSLFRRLVIPGIIGAVLGALALSLFGEEYGHWIRPLMAIYILFLGIKYILLSFRGAYLLKQVKHVGRLAGVGGFIDSFGGGGWGPLVTTTLLRTSDQPGKIIGSVSLTEFFVTLASAFTFFTMLGISHWAVIAGLTIGGVLASPIAARLAGRLNKKTSYFLIGVLASAWSVRILVNAFF
jgi:uncharacterized membrane protein YfcA